MNDEMLEVIKEGVKQLGTMDPDEITEFFQLIQKYWIGLETGNHIAS